jgi:hypothetical protein
MDRGKSYKILARKPEGKRPPTRPKHRREDIRMDHKEMVAVCGLKLSGSGQGPVADV